MMKKFIYIVSFFWAIPQGFAQLNLVQFEQIDSLQKVEKRNVLVFIHTDWCKYCKVMQDKTFKNKEVIKVLNERFYFVDFDAEETRTIVFNQNDFNFVPNGNNSGVNKLSIELGSINGEISYPILCILNFKNEIIFQGNGFFNVKDLMNIFDNIKK